MADEAKKDTKVAEWNKIVNPNDWGEMAYSEFKNGLWRLRDALLGTPDALKFNIKFGMPETDELVSRLGWERVPDKWLFRKKKGA